MGLDDRKGEARRDFSNAKGEWLAKGDKIEAFENAKKVYAEERQKRSNPQPTLQPKHATRNNELLERKRLAELSDRELAKKVEERKKQFPRWAEKSKERDQDREK
jgi:hypothetical protein